jgi:hypothetical protein
MKLSFVGEESFIREKSQTIKIKGQKLLAASDMFR